jgi:hypothetical protein
MVMSLTLGNCCDSDFEISPVDAPSPSSTRALCRTGETQRLFSSLANSRPAFSMRDFNRLELVVVAQPHHEPRHRVLGRQTDRLEEDVQDR